MYLAKTKPKNHYKDYDELYNAQIIQQGLLPKRRHFKRIFNDSFVVYIPQNIISGDFYWIGEKKNFKYLVVGDCTGHGISAALLSVLAINLFQYAIMNKGIKKTNKILQEVDRKFIESFKNSDTGNFDNPWIDLSIVCIDELEKKIYFSAANRKMLHISGTEVNLHVGNRYPIGGWQIERNRIFNSTVIDYNPGDLIYLGSDGFQDQMGGVHNKKYRSQQLHSLLYYLSRHPLARQKDELIAAFHKWKGEYEQIDDVCIVGIQL